MRSRGRGRGRGREHFAGRGRGGEGETSKDSRNIHGGNPKWTWKKMINLEIKVNIKKFSVIVFGYKICQGTSCITLIYFSFVASTFLHSILNVTYQ